MAQPSPNFRNDNHGAGETINMTSLNDPIRSLMLLLLTEQCYDKFFLEFNFLDVDCLKAAFSKSLGLSIILGSTLVKVPQIVKILQAKSAQGIAIWGVLLEILAISLAFAYNFTNGYPFSSWGELVFLLVETSIIGFLVFLFNGQLGLALTFVTSLVTLLYVLSFGLTPPKVLWAMQAANLPIVVAAKLLQALANARQGHTGQLSMATFTLLLAGSCARIFTSIQETNDTILVLTAASAAAANAVLFGQILYYKEATLKALKKSNNIGGKTGTSRSQVESKKKAQ